MDLERLTALSARTERQLARSRELAELAQQTLADAKRTLRQAGRLGPGRKKPPGAGAHVGG